MTDISKATAQRMVDRNVAARIELEASNKEISDYLTEVETVDKEIHAFVDAYRNPTVANPPPIDPAVAATPPAEEPAVFTDVSSTDLAPEETSGGFAETIAEPLAVPEAAPAE